LPNTDSTLGHRVIISAAMPVVNGKARLPVPGSGFRRGTRSKVAGGARRLAPDKPCSRCHICGLSELCPSPPL
ncbi:MAG: hypothetical protein ACYSTZ_11275, partial [Planctomycetota bacterium]